MGIQKKKEAVISGCPILFFPCALRPTPNVYLGPTTGLKLGEI